VIQERRQRPGLEVAVRSVGVAAEVVMLAAWAAAVTVAAAAMPVVQEEESLVESLVAEAAMKARGLAR
jgi:hypothetical protein